MMALSQRERSILLDTEKLEVRLPDGKLRRLQLLLAEWRDKRSCTKRDLLSLIGTLQHACRVVPPGRSFLRRMIDLSKVAKQLYHHVRLNAEFRSDLEWWVTFLPGWNGVGMLSSLCKRPHSQIITSDASGLWGCGAFTASGKWFQFEWPDQWASIHITVKELLPVVMSCALWGHRWKGESVLARSDNAAVVAIINSGRSKDKLVMHLMRCLFFFMARNEHTLVATHVEGKLNVAADALSRNRLSVFRQQVPTADAEPARIPPELQELLVTNRPDWTSPEWKKLWMSFSQKVWRRQPSGPTRVERSGT